MTALSPGAILLGPHAVVHACGRALNSKLRLGHKCPTMGIREGRRVPSPRSQIRAGEAGSSRGIRSTERFS